MSASSDQIRQSQLASWEKFSAGWKKWDDYMTGWMAPFGDAMIQQAKIGEAAQVLDIASGTGEPGLSAAARVPHGGVTLTDLSPNMLAVATDKAHHRGLTNVKTVVSDAASLPFEDGSFDAVLCRFGYIFFPDMAAAAAEHVRLGRSGARICAAVWAEPGKNQWATTIMSAIARHVDVPQAPAGAPGLFRCAAPGLMSELFSGAGLLDVGEIEVSAVMHHESPESYWELMSDVAAPVVASLAGVDASTVAKIRAEVLEAVLPGTHDGAVDFSAGATIVVGTVG
ncbi:class I SAM-dependent methyltransferase [Pseudarthrobacter sp. J1738]|uniref:class I SAM-dependent methyltransferase n=1 Tax=Pseudarthrobacter sp. J1738 TaxID=3420446 RepID=UPI003D2AFC45